MSTTQVPKMAWAFLIPAAMLGTVGTPPAWAAALPTMSAIHGSASGTGTLPSPGVLQTAQLPRPLSERVSQLREASGLTAQQLARLFDVSRRAVNHWLSGKPMAEEHEARLGHLEDVIGRLPGSSGTERRRALLAGSGDASIYQQLCAEVRTSEPLQGVGLTLEEQVR